MCLPGIGLPPLFLGRMGHILIAQQLGKAIPDNLPVFPHNLHFPAQGRKRIQSKANGTDKHLKAEALRGIVRKIVFYKDTNTLEFHYYLMVD